MWPLPQDLAVILVVTQDSDGELADALRGDPWLEDVPVVAVMAKPKPRNGKVAIHAHGVPGLIRTTQELLSADSHAC